MRFVFLILLLSYKASAQTGTIKSDSFYSTILKETRYYDIYIPSGPKEPFEVIYVLDGAAHFGNTVNTLKQIGFTRKIIVGLGNIWLRDRDYTPTAVKSFPGSGGGDKFIASLKELIPLIILQYPVSKPGVLIGHSYGGLMVMDILLHHTKMFNKYIAIDPSMWWDDQKLLNQSKKILSDSTFNNISLFLAVADTTQKPALSKPSLTLVDYLKANKQNKLKFEWKYYPNEDHMSVPIPAMRDGLKFLLQ